MLGAIVQAATPRVAVTTVERADTLRLIWGLTRASCACSVPVSGELLCGELLCGGLLGCELLCAAGCCWASALLPSAAWLPWCPSSTVAVPAPIPTITATTTMAMSLPRRRLGGVDRRGGGDTIRRVDDGPNCCGEDADGHGGDDVNSCGEDADGHGGDDVSCSGEDVDGHGGDDSDSCGVDVDGHGGNDADRSGEDPDGHGGNDADCSGEDPDGHGWAGGECHAGGGGGGADVGGKKVGCPGGEDPPSHGAVGCQPGSGSGDGKSAVGHCSAVTSVPQETQNRADSSGRGCPHDGHQRATVPPKSAPPGRFHAVPGPAPLPVSPATEVSSPSRRRVITRLQSRTRL